MKGRTWSNDSQGLFDYDCDRVTRSVHRTTSNCTLLRLGNQTHLNFEPFKPTAAEDLSYMAYIHLENGHFSVMPINSIHENCDKIWLVIKSLKSQGKEKGYRLSEGDILKLGRVKLRVKEISTESCPAEFNFDNSLEEAEEGDLTFSLPCKVCLSEKYDLSNPLISPCSCAGTMKYIHLRCLQNSLKSKITQLASSNFMSLEWSKLVCDLCKKNFPIKLSINHKVVDIVDIPKPPGKFLILENLSRKLSNSKGLYVVSFARESSLKLGRSTESDIRINDISVSRTHAMLYMKNGAVYIEDTNSKFGTLVQVKRPILIDKKLHLQIGRTLMKFVIQQRWSLVPACFKSSHSPYENMPVVPGAVPLLPINTGIPLSVSDPQELINRFYPKKNKKNSNLLYECKSDKDFNSNDNEPHIIMVENVEAANSSEGFYAFSDFIN